MKKFIQKYRLLSLKQKYYLYFVFFLFCWALLIGWNIRSDNNTSGIYVSQNYELLECDSEIRLYTHNDASSFETQSEPDMTQTIKEQICALDQNFDGSVNDRITLFSYSVRILEFWTVNRPDIAQYFYRKIISANEDDALSLYIKQEKLK
jgi:hypothetical protein